MGLFEDKHSSDPEIHTVRPERLLDRFFVTGLLVVLAAAAFPSLALDVVRHPPAENQYDMRSLYYIELMALALKETEADFGPYQLQAIDSLMTQSRSITSLQRDELIDVLWTMTSAERESLLLPVRIPLLKGLLGYRIFIIHRGDEARFSAIKAIDELKALQAGQGHDWPDTDILRQNGFQVHSSSSYEGLFKMLENRRIDYYPRGAHEPWAEIKTYGDGELVIEKTLAVHYPAPSFFFVSPGNVDLAKRLETGLERALKDGSFDQLLRNHPVTKDIFVSANLADRRVFSIPNPLLTEETRRLVDRKELWFNP